uniref:Antigen 5 related protein n=1 Tax=Phlebotomus duboscqi TaxID=37738 RepID=Q06K33_PHLDU|nr:antigen 5 related protein [Phlebotomus duboscqi]
MLQIKNLLVIVVLFVTVQSQNEKYCDQNLCTSNNVVKPHIGCKNDGQFKKSCPGDAEVVNLSKKQKNLFLKIHNRLRDRLAHGSVTPFQPAAKMPMLKWNDELAKLAEYNVRTCKFAHDQCRATKICRYAGQNLGQMQSFPEFLNTNIAIKNITREWFREYKDATQDNTDMFTSGRNGRKQIGHFTAFIHEKSDKVGCAVAKFTNNNKFKEYLIACNYCYTNMMKEPIYTKGPPCSQCKNKKCGTVYKNLCPADEKVDPTPEILKNQPRRG